MPSPDPNAPTAFLKALTPEAERSLSGPSARIPHFPFRVGRDSRRRIMPLVPSRRKQDSPPSSDLYLKERGAAAFVSREHCLIDFRNGVFVLEDRGSFYGTLVEGVQVGGQKLGGHKPLSHGDVLIFGGSGSPFAFKFLTEPPPETETPKPAK
ncbi:MAG: FHA domain-containing protein [Candidatus Aminicenantes bacterium]|nr:FHA domain-containing protein [Candidatus Aminicenantes bacterium]